MLMPLRNLSKSFNMLLFVFPPLEKRKKKVHEGIPLHFSRYVGPPERWSDYLKLSLGQPRTAAVIFLYIERKTKKKSEVSIYTYYIYILSSGCASYITYVPPAIFLSLYLFIYLYLSIIPRFFFFLSFSFLFHLKIPPTYFLIFLVLVYLVWDRAIIV